MNFFEVFSQLVAKVVAAVRLKLAGSQLLEVQVEASCEKKLHSSAWSWLLPPQLSCWKTPFTHSADQERHRRRAWARAPL